MVVMASEDTGHLMKCSALATSASVTSLTVLETVLLLNLTENDNVMVVISFKLVANQSCYNQINLGVMFDQFYKRKQF